MQSYRVYYVEKLHNTLYSNQRHHHKQSKIVDNFYKQEANHEIRINPVTIRKIHEDINSATYILLFLPVSTQGKNRYCRQEYRRYEKYKTGVQDGESMHQIFLEKGLKNGRHLFPVTNNDQNLSKLFLGRIDLMYFNNYTGACRLNKFNHSMTDVEKLLVLEEWDTISALTKQYQKI